MNIENRTGWMKFIRILAWVLFAVIVFFALILGLATGFGVILIVPLGVLLAFATVSGIFLKLDLLEDFHSMRISLEDINYSLQRLADGGEMPVQPLPVEEPAPQQDGPLFQPPQE